MKVGMKMQINFNVTGSERKKLVTAIAEITGTEARYLGAPSFTYEVGHFKFDKNGILSCADSIDIEEIKKILDALIERGFNFQYAETPHEEIVVEIPRTLLSNAQLEKLACLVASKETLIKHALGVQSLPIEINDEKISFPWFNYSTDTDTIAAYTNLVSTLWLMAKKRIRINAVDKPVENEKYAFRCFLLQLGFIGGDFRIQRKILLSKLTGNSAFKSGKKTEATDDE